MVSFFMLWATENVQPSTGVQQGAGAEAIKQSPPSVFVNSEPMREEQVQNAVKFLSHPKVRGSPVMYRRSFLEKKGLTKEEIDEAFRRVPVNKLFLLAHLFSYMPRCLIIFFLSLWILNVFVSVHSSPLTFSANCRTQPQAHRQPVLVKVQDLSMKVGWLLSFVISSSWDF
jgi:hypothetical protein